MCQCPASVVGHNGISYYLVLRFSIYIEFSLIKCFTNTLQLIISAPTWIVWKYSRFADGETAADGIAGGKAKSAFVNSSIWYLGCLLYICIWLIFLIIVCCTSLHWFGAVLVKVTDITVSSAVPLSLGGWGIESGTYLDGKAQIPSIRADFPDKYLLLIDTKKFMNS